jgi:hypothetical protein
MAVNVAKILACLVDSKKAKKAPNDKDDDDDEDDDDDDDDDDDEDVKDDEGPPMDSKFNPKRGAHKTYWNTGNFYLTHTLLHTHTHAPTHA